MVGEGVERPSHPELDDLSEKIQAFKDRAKFIKQGKEDAEAQSAEFMQKAGLKFYETAGGKAVTLKSGKVTVSVTKMNEKAHE